MRSEWLRIKPTVRITIANYAIRSLKRALRREDFRTSPPRPRRWCSTTQTTLGATVRWCAKRCPRSERRMSPGRGLLNERVQEIDGKAVLLHLPPGHFWSSSLNSKQSPDGTSGLWGDQAERAAWPAACSVEKSTPFSPYVSFFPAQGYLIGCG